MNLSIKIMKCPMCAFNYSIPDMSSYKQHADAEMGRHFRNVHGLMSVLQHEQELYAAIEKATIEGEQRGRQEIRGEMKRATEEAILDLIDRIGWK